MPVTPVPSAKGEHSSVPNVGRHPRGCLRSALVRVRCVTLPVTRGRRGSCSGHGLQHRRSPHRPAAPRPGRGGRVRLLVRAGARLAGDGRPARPARHGVPVRRPGAAVRCGGGALAQACRHGPGGAHGPQDAVPGGRGERRRARRAARLAGVGRGRPGSRRPGCGWPDHRPGSPGTAPWPSGGRRVAAAPEQGCEALLPALPGLPGRGAGPARGPDLVRLVAAAATECHRARLRRRATPCGQALAFS